MRTYGAVITFAVFLGLASLAQAARLLSPPLPTDTETAGWCRILNTGTTPVTMQVRLFSNQPGPLSIDFDSCNQAPLPGGQACAVLVEDLPDASYFACTVTASNVSKLRGSIELLADFGNVGSRVLMGEELR